jgi:hypothetical protein
MTPFSRNCKYLFNSIVFSRGTKFYAEDGQRRGYEPEAYSHIFFQEAEEEEEER